MLRRRFFLSIVVLLVAFAACALVAAFFFKQMPDFYVREIANRGTPEDASLAINTVSRIGDLQAAIFRDADWGASFTAEDVNAVMRENRTRQSDLSAKLFGDLEEPRIAIEGDRLRIAFRYGQGFWSTIISVDLRMWLVADEPNTIAIEVAALRAGTIPLNKQWPLDQISEALRSQHAEITWYRNGSNPVGLCRLFVNRPQQDAILQGVKMADGRFTVYGRHTDLSMPAPAESR